MSHCEVGPEVIVLTKVISCAPTIFFSSISSVIPTLLDRDREGRRTRMGRRMKRKRKGKEERREGRREEGREEEGERERTPHFSSANTPHWGPVP